MTFTCSALACQIVFVFACTTPRHLQRPLLYSFVKGTGCFECIVVIASVSKATRSRLLGTELSNLLALELSWATASLGNVQCGPDVTTKRDSRREASHAQLKLKV
jgi:hypothetical protein